MINLSIYIKASRCVPSQLPPQLSVQNDRLCILLFQLRRSHYSSRQGSACQGTRTTPSASQSSPTNAIVRREAAEHHTIPAVRALPQLKGTVWLLLRSAPLAAEVGACDSL
ncbi:hypothetical protein Q8A67_024500 [Cirrhinus molitorella]|uniref:Uncharacterized protein n=1 Tax=Cirrhinus molitorella TaxID=172907 RepID=A0AA88TBU9_9TELE|nr:hypothetical protein Q8A67_024500 [Cirrhinus molitorella]